MNPFIKKSLQELVPYHANHIIKGIKLDANENAYGLPSPLKEKLQTLDIHRYPDTDSTALLEKLASIYEVATQNVVCGVGSDQLIDCLLRAVLEEGDKVLCPDPSFSMYKLTTKINGGTYVPLPLEEDFSYSTEAYIEAIKTHQPKVTFICNPNNPTGSYLSQQHIRTIADLGIGIVVIDEAYGEFAKESAASLVKEYDNLVVLKTFSKAYALAGARIGYGIGSPAVIDAICRVKPPYNVNVFSQEAALLVLEHQALFDESIQKLCQNRESLYEGLKELGLGVYPSLANFLWVESELALDALLEKEEIYIRKLAYNGKPYYRITVGTEEENKTLLEKLRALKEIK
jgi:histidinol-phosphate aminotransferase